LPSHHVVNLSLVNSFKNNLDIFFYFWGNQEVYTFDVILLEPETEV